MGRGTTARRVRALLYHAGGVRRAVRAVSAVVALALLCTAPAGCAVVDDSKPPGGAPSG